MLNQDRQKSILKALTPKYPRCIPISELKQTLNIQSNEMLFANLFYLFEQRLVEITENNLPVQSNENCEHFLNRDIRITHYGVDNIAHETDATTIFSPPKEKATQPSGGFFEIIE
ncbi:hypothetical protein [Chromobacterium violaceum]|uniref:hypothetical protein n=1 Tax=Chromobacterium violaceum TaxID=536 RepID=UPI00194E609D|nr:hypothetical protein [Chromobacterium violaceum]QRO34147.1 hypothetical protein I6K04_05225 [Chromobacterium violaceum]QRQ16050.1 hypothetical protein I6K03_17505 [Chromobacterium violaceum]